MDYLYEDIKNYNIDEMYKGVSKARLEKMKKFGNPVTNPRALSSLAVEYALNILIQRAYPDIETPVELTYDENRKPHLFLPDRSDEENIFISLSHAGSYVACMVSDKPCGIDIEIHKNRDYKKIAARVLTPGELERVKDSYDFYNIWTLKEAALKACGLGLSYDMRLIQSDNIIINGIKYAGTNLSAPAGYSLSYCVAV